MAIDAGKDLVKVTGTMDAGALPGYLRDKLSRAVDVVAPGKKDGGGGRCFLHSADGENRQSSRPELGTGE